MARGISLNAPSAQVGAQMCLGIPMKVIKINDDFAQVESGRLLRTINIQMLPNVKTGDYVIVHAGFAIEKLDPKRAKETLRLLDEIR
ncbi:MAG: HypC/HybG/HupF family hydrogenase formation chaperone [Candidatus Omnitrophica bacterium]|nr:HypC/HybG/HupF family hydrogenase formation chaperone [Candidatus Omnitrophota bacterium]